MNGEPLPHANGFPLRLITLGWYGIANVKWLKRIEVRETRYMGRFMARDYVTIREEPRDGETVWMETSVGRALLKVGAGEGDPAQRAVSHCRCRLGCPYPAGRGPDRCGSLGAGDDRSQ
jgi:DMSO/TMAO reductase YedYZ molybdopterin-dependent catalytic subunit